MATSSKPHIVVVGGSFTTPAMYSVFTDTLSDFGFSTSTPAHRTVGRKSPPATMYDDAANIAADIRTQVDAGKEVVLVTHSYGGVPGTQSLKDLTVKERKAAGLEGGVSKVIYTSSIVPRVGHSIGDELARGAPAEADGPSPFTVTEDGYLALDPMATGESTFHHLPADERTDAARGFVMHSAQSFGDPLTHAGYRDVPVTYILFTEDRVFSADVQRSQIANIEEAGGKVDVLEVPSDHGWSASRPRSMARIVAENLLGGSVVGEGIREQI